MLFSDLSLLGNKYLNVKMKEKMLHLISYCKTKIEGILDSIR